MGYMDTIPAPPIITDTPPVVNPPDLLSDLPPYEQATYEIVAATQAIGNELARIETARLSLMMNFSPATALVMLPVFEYQLGLPISPPQLTIGQRRQFVLAALGRLKSGGSGLAWENAITSLVGSNWSYQEHNPADITSPAANILRLTLPIGTPAFAPPSLTATPITGGSLTAGTYYYAVAAITVYGETLPSPIVSATVAASGKVTLGWPPQGAPITAFQVYRGSSSTSLRLLASPATNTYVDDGTAVPGTEAPATTDTSGSPSAVSLLSFIDRITPAHLEILVDYGGGFIVGVSRIGIDVL